MNKYIVPALSVTLLITTSFAIAALNDGDSTDSLFGKVSEFELERLAPRTELDMLTTNLVGENISLADGSLSFSNTDISIPTNMGVSASISRIYQRLSGRNDKEAAEFGDWQLDIPRIESTVLKGDHRWTPNYDVETACSSLLTAGPISAAFGKVVEQHEYWNGADLTIPGQALEKILSGNNQSDYTTKENTKIDCKTDATNKEYFVVTTPNGLTYELASRRLVSGVSLIRNLKKATRQRLVYQVTNIKDRFGNELLYKYVSEKLSSIAFKETGTNDYVELIKLNYLDGLITEAIAQGKLWQYEYSGQNLSKVIRPDNRAWEYDFPSFTNYAPTIGFESHISNGEYLCKYKVFSNGDGSMSITHPFGTKATFNYALKVHGRTETPSEKMLSKTISSTLGMYNINGCYGNLSIKNKTLKINDKSYLWEYKFSNNGIHWNTDNWRAEFWGNIQTPSFNRIAIYGNNKDGACAVLSECNSIPSDLGLHPFDLRVLTITQPDGHLIKHYISKRWDHTENKTIATQWFDKSNPTNPKKTVKTTFIQGQYKGHSHLVDPITTSNDLSHSIPALKQQQIIIENTNTYTTNYTKYNEYEALEESHAFNSVTPSLKRYTKKDYFNDTSHWLLNLPLNTQLSNDDVQWKTIKETTYHSSTGSYKSLPYEQKILGNVIRINTNYHDNGNVKRVDYNGSNRYELFDNYQFGQAGKITLPCSTTNGCNTVNSSTVNTMIANVEFNTDATIKSITDFNGNSTAYSYNPMGWLTGINYADTQWTDKTISYDTVVTNGDGIGGNILEGMLRQTVTQGNYEKRTYLDSLLRPILSQERDKTNNETIRYQRMSYNHDNQVTLNSFPSTSPSDTLGIKNTYDALGRLEATLRQSDSSTSYINYLSGNRKQTINGNGNAITTTYRAYGSPSYSLPTLIKAEDSSDTVIAYNEYDQIKAITQGSVTETRLYDNYQQLCKTIRPETGITAMAYNTQRKLAWSAQGTTGSNTACDLNSVPTAHRVLMGYDNLGQPQNENYPDSSPDKTYTYDNNGNITKLQAGNNVWNYKYNSQNGLDKETLSVDGKSFVLDWEYNGLGAVSALTYPSNLKISYLPNALGQATKAGEYAKALTYYPNGQLKEMTFGNGVVRTLAQDSTGRLKTINDGYQSTDLIDLSIDYDNNDNIKSVADSVYKSSLRDLFYDDSDRLLSVTGDFGTVGYKYDGLGNIKTHTLNGAVTTYNYDTNNRLKNTSGAYNYTYNYDDSGNVINNRRFALTFNRSNQLVSILGNTNGLAVSHDYDGYNRRIKKVNNGEVTYSVYSKVGQLFYQVNTNNDKQTNHIYANEKLIAKVTNGLDKPVINISSPLPGSGNISITWGRVDNATNYILEERATNGTWSNLYSGSSLSSSAIKSVSGDYEYRVKACNAVGCSSFDNGVANVLFKPSMPSNISVPVATDIDGSYLINWSYINYASSYRLYESLNNGVWFFVDTLTTVNTTVSGTKNGSYRYGVEACNAAGCSGRKDSTSFSVFLPPSVPSSISAPTGTDIDGSYTISWPSVSTATSYTLIQSVNSGNWTTVSTNAGLSQTFSGKGNATYRYGVKACNSSGCGSYKYSSTFTVLLPPPLPGSITAPTSTDTDGAYIVSWPSVNTATSYTLIQSVNSGSWTTISTNAGLSKAFSGKGNATYRYAVKACNSSGCGDYLYSLTFNVLHPPTSPSISYASKVHTDLYKISWSISYGATSYTLQEYKFGKWVDVYNGNGRSKILNSIHNTNHIYRIKACNNSGCSGYTQGNNIWIIKPNLTMSFVSPVIISPQNIELNWYALGADRCSVPLYPNLNEIGSKDIFIYSTQNYSMTCYFGDFSITKSDSIKVKFGGGNGPDF